MPELPEVEITARRLDGALRGAVVESALAPGVNALKTFAPPLSDLAGSRVVAVRRRGKHLIVDFSNDLSLLIHLMSAGRLQLFDKHAGPRDRTSRLLVRVAAASDGSTSDGSASDGSASDGSTSGGSASGGSAFGDSAFGGSAFGDASGAGPLPPGSELRLREFGTKQRAWVKLLPTADIESDEAIAGLGPEAWPDPPNLLELLAVPRPLHALLRDQHVIAGIGRSWADEILWNAQLSPFKRGDTLTEDEAELLRATIVQTLGDAIAHYEEVVELPIPDKLPMPLRIHRHEGEDCPRCDRRLEPVHFEDYVIAYCPHCQTGDKVLKDRRLSRLLK